MSLAAGGILLALVGREMGSPLLQDKVGPVVTLGGALVWLLGRPRRR